MDPTYVIDNLAMMRKQITQLLAALTIPSKRARAGQERLGPLEKRKPPTFEIALRWNFAMMFAEHRLVFEQVKLAWAAGHEQKDHRFRPAGKMGWPRSHR